MNLSNSDFYVDGEVCAETYLKYDELKSTLYFCKVDMRLAYLALNSRDWSGKGKDQFDLEFNDFVNSIDSVYVLMQQIEDALRELVEDNKVLIERTGNFSLLKYSYDTEYRF